MQHNSREPVIWRQLNLARHLAVEESTMKETWSKPEVTEQEVGLEVTSYVAAELKDA